jgi:hypothetical protein
MASVLQNGWTDEKVKANGISPFAGRRSTAMTTRMKTKSSASIRLCNLVA